MTDKTAKQLDVIIANPAGNTTIFVLTPVPISEYQEISKKLLEIDFGKEYGISFSEPSTDSVLGEQVGFILPERIQGLPAMNMCGQEFCGNASRSFAYYRVAHFGDGTLQPDGTRVLQIRASGCNHPLKANIDIKKSNAQIQMPLPAKIIDFTGKELGLDAENPRLVNCSLVILDGISHLVLEDISATEETFHRIREYIYNKIGTMDAFGIMFLDTVKAAMSPVVYVRDVNTTYFEGSCASGTAAASYVLALNKTDGSHDFTFRQPNGTLYTTVKKEAGEITEISLSGLLELSDIISLEL